MARAGPLLASVVRLVDELGAELIRDLPTSPLPVRLWEEPGVPALRADLRISLGSDPRGHCRTRDRLRGRGLHVTWSAGSLVVGWAYVDALADLLALPDDLLIEAASVPAMTVLANERDAADTGACLPLEPG